MSSEHTAEPRGLIYQQRYTEESERVRISGITTREHYDAWVYPDTTFGFQFFATGAPIRIQLRSLRRSWPTTKTMMMMSSSGSSDSTSPIESAPRVIARMRQPSLGGFEGTGGLMDPGWGDPLPPQPPDPPPENATHTPAIVRLYAPGRTEPTKEWPLEGGVDTFTREVEFAPDYLPAPDSDVYRRGWWRCTITPTGPDPASVWLQVTANTGTASYHHQVLSKRLIDRLLSVVLEALTPDVRISRSTIRFSLARELAEMYDILEPVRFAKDLDPIETDFKLRSFDVQICSAADAIKAAEDRIARANADGDTDKASRIESYKTDFEKRVQDDFVAVRFVVAFQDATLHVYGIDLLEIEDDLGELFLAFSPTFTFVEPLVLLEVDFKLLLELAEILGDLPFTDDVLEDEEIPTKIMDTIRSYGPTMASYFREALSRMVARDGVALEARAQTDGWRIKYFHEPPEPDPSEPVRVEVGDVPTEVKVDDLAGTGTGTGTGDSGVQPTREGLSSLGISRVATLRTTTSSTRSTAGSTTAATTATPSPSPTTPTTLASEGPFTWPEGFEVTEGAALDRLDRIGTLVVVMMENRSFDHMLGDLQRARPRPGDSYNCFPPGASNPPAGGFIDPIPFVPATSIGLDTAIPVSPHHDFERILFQMGGGTPETAGNGAMQGFTRDIIDRSDAPQLVMSYYTERELPTYYRLADEFMVCDAWFCAHPGPTWPNRWITLAGTTPELDNFGVTDPRFGFLEEKTIFDVLSQHGIEWRYFESDVSMVRMFDNFRLDDRRVLPLHDDRDGLEALLASGEPLPRVIFIDPNFADLPPVASASDDHPPADIGHGQDFIAEICNILWTSGRWSELSLVITYDEHGGFYDHVAPPGTELSAWPEKVPRVHPEGADCMGPRVPAFVISPYVSAGSVCHQVFDHTSIIKTILVHNRDRLRTDAFTSFGPRVNAAAHLGVALDLDAPRPAPQPFNFVEPTDSGRGLEEPEIPPGGHPRSRTPGEALDESATRLESGKLESGVVLRSRRRTRARRRVRPTLARPVTGTSTRDHRAPSKRPPPQPRPTAPMIERPLVRDTPTTNHETRAEPTPKPPVADTPERDSTTITAERDTTSVSRPVADAPERVLAPESETSSSPADDTRIVRNTLVVIRDAPGWDEVPPDPDDFHASLRLAMRTRRPGKLPKPLKD